MFSAFSERMQADLGRVKSLVDLHDHALKLFYSSVSHVRSPVAAPNEAGDQWSAVRLRDPGKLSWQIYNHCAAVTRLYAIYSAFVEDLVAEYLKILPRLYETYDLLPEAVLNQHRTGVGQILLKLGDTGPYRHLKEGEIIPKLAHGLTGGHPYGLLKEAFLIDRQNYRFEVLGKLLGYLGIEAACARISSHPLMKSFLSERRGDGATCESELNDFVRLRNLAAHGQAEDVVSPDEHRLIADFISVLCSVLTELLAKAVMLRRVELGQYVDLGVIIHVYHENKVAIVKMNSASIRVDDEVVLVREKRSAFAKIRTIQNEGVSVDSFVATGGEELGIELSHGCRVGEVLRRMQIDVTPSPKQEDLFMTVELAASLSDSVSTLDDELEIAPSENESVEDGGVSPAPGE
jgi:hypothetical protein